jgi:hypothetical protein
MYPRLYTSARPGNNTVLQSKGDIAVGLLMEMLVDRRFPHARWAFQSQVLDCALRLFGDFSQWVEMQRQNPQVAGASMAFVEETLRFIEGTPRELSLANWIELVPQGQANIHLADLQVPRITPRLHQSPSTVKALQLWCSRPDGLEDLLESLHLLFGRARP